MKYVYITLLSIVLISFSNLTFSQHEKPYIRKGTEEYMTENYGNSEVSFQKALDKNPDSFEAKFNLADAFYKQEKYEEAIKEFSTLAEQTTDKKKLSEIYHNIGNSQLKQTKKILTEKKLKGAISQLDKSILSYKNALKNNPTDRETKFNLSYAQNLKKLLEDQQKKNQNKQDKNQQNKQDQQDQKKQDNQDKNQQNKNEQNQNQNQNKQNQNQNNSDENDSDGDGIPDKIEKGNQPDKQPRDSDKDGTPDYKDNDSDNDGKSDSEEAGQNPKEPQDTDKDGLPDYRDLDSNNDGKPDSEENKQNQANSSQISKEDALRMLEAIENNEKDVQGKLKRVKGAKHVKKEKDW